jgi:hypothetical protein
MCRGNASVQDDNGWGVRARWLQSEFPDILRGYVVEQLEVSNRLRREFYLINAIGCLSQLVELSHCEPNKKIHLFRPDEFFERLDSAGAYELARDLGSTGISI